jgi:hypothetical protein
MHSRGGSDSESLVEDIHSRFQAQWCSWLTRHPVKVEIAGSSPVWVAEIEWASHRMAASDGSDRSHLNLLIG